MKELTGVLHDAMANAIVNYADSKEKENLKLMREF